MILKHADSSPLLGLACIFAPNIQTGPIPILFDCSFCFCFVPTGSLVILRFSSRFILRFNKWFVLWLSSVLCGTVDYSLLRFRNRRFSFSWFLVLLLSVLFGLFFGFLGFGLLPWIFLFSSNLLLLQNFWPQKKNKNWIWRKAREKEGG